ncbi:hypothetical protein [Aliivibrio fischeri]|uniref:hypothetical protein n=1 Tax=Aliivibrio fischeri TaxID=668 RepID=UPI0012D85C69|nr:hypothetical protein [Aliivibrio fischeri]MUJ20446.1 hypothetical protein [Aliivibrio fischeri]
MNKQQFTVFQLIETLNRLNLDESIFNDLVSELPCQAAKEYDRQKRMFISACLNIKLLLGSVLFSMLFMFVFKGFLVEFEFGHNPTFLIVATYAVGLFFLVEGSCITLSAKRCSGFALLMVVHDLESNDKYFNLKDDIQKVYSLAISEMY